VPQHHKRSPVQSFGQGPHQSLSAGSQPLGQLNAGAVALLQRHRVATDGLSSKSWKRLKIKQLISSLPCVITQLGNLSGLFASVAQGALGLVRSWACQGTVDEVKAAFEATYRTVEQRINLMLALPLEDMSIEALVTELNAIGKLDS